MSTPDMGETTYLGRRRFLQATGTVAGTGLLAGCSSLTNEPADGDTESPDDAGGNERNQTVATTAAKSDDEPVRLGLSLPFTGFMAEEGPEMILGLEFWRRNLNASGGLLDRPVELVVYDDGSSEDGAAAAYRRLLDEDEVDLVLGTGGTLQTAGATRVLEERGMPAVFPMAWGPYAQDIEREWCTHFLPIATEAPRGLAEVLAELDIETFAMIKSSSGYVRDGAEGLRQFLNDVGIEVVAEVTYERNNDTERRQAVDDIAAVGADAIGPGGSVAEVGPLIDEVVERNLDATAFAWFDFDDTRIFSRIEHTEGMLGLGMWTAGVPYPGNERYVAEFTEWAEARRPDWSRVQLLQHHPPAAYSSALVLQRAVEAAGSLDPTAVRDALWALETDTPFGTFAVDDEGYQVGKEMFVIQHQRALREVVWPPDLQTSEPRLPTLERAGNG